MLFHSLSVHTDLKTPYVQTAETALRQNGSHSNSGPERSIHAMKLENVSDLTYNMSPMIGVQFSSVL